jgi:acetyl-CoA C-acetyltransferase
MEDTVIVSYARTALCKSFRGSFNATHGAVLGAHAVREAIRRAGIEAAEVEDVILGCGFPEGATGLNIGRQVALAAGCPDSVPGLTLNRFCASGLQAIAMAAQRIQAGEAEVFVAGGVESISAVQPAMNAAMLEDEGLKRTRPAIYWPMLQTASLVLLSITFMRVITGTR